MKAQVYRGEQQLCYEEIEPPEIGVGEILLEVAAAGVSPRDIDRILSPVGEAPRIFGSEIAGTIAAVGEQVQGWRVGQRVAVRSQVPCLRCQDCFREQFSRCQAYRSITTSAGFTPSGGGFAEFVRIPQHLVENRAIVAIPSYLDWDRAALLEPVQRCLGVIARMELQPGQLVWILGAGSLGSLFTLLLHRFGIRTIVTDGNLDRLDQVRDLGAEAAIENLYDDLHTKIHAFTDGLGSDATIITIPEPYSLDHAIDGTKPGGKIAIVCDDPGVKLRPIVPSLLVHRELHLLGGFHLSIRQSALAESLLFDQRFPLERIISHRYPLADLSMAIYQAAIELPETRKIMVYPHLKSGLFP